MDKLSLYDILGMLLPGISLLFFVGIINNIYGFFPENLSALGEINDIKELSILLCFSIIAGASLYVVNFYLVNKVKWYNKLFGMYKPIAKLYLKMSSLHPIINDQLNKKAIERFHVPIFFTQPEFDSLDDKDQETALKNQDQFYDVMYYELEHFGKIGYAKDFQSYYFFFRQMVTALLIAFGGILLSFAYWFICKCNYPDVLVPSTKLLFFIIFLIVICTQLAQWYRKRMVMKMYWAYYTLLNNQEK